MSDPLQVLIIEDERLAADHLQKLLEESRLEILILDRIDSVKNAIIWFSKHASPDLVFMDIDLGDGLCFEIFEASEIKSPIIFTTAYDEYAIRAFKVNSIDYLLKPIALEETESAIEKYYEVAGPSSGYLNRISKAADTLTPGYKERFVIKIGEHLKTLPISQIRYFFSRDKGSFAGAEDQRNYLVDYTLENLEDLVDPQNFFRISRKYIVRYDAIKDIITYSNSRLRIILLGSDDNDIIVSRDRVNSFKEWLDR